MSKSWLYVPGLAVPNRGAAQDFQDRISDTFPDDPYLSDMVKTLLHKGATPLGCEQSLRWIEIPQAPVPEDKLHPSSVRPPPRVAAPALPSAKAFKILGRPEDNLLGRQAGGKPEPITVKLKGYDVLPCTAPQFISQAKPSVGRTHALASIGKGDTLYVVGHSNPNGASLSYRFPPPPAHDIKKCNGTWHCEQRHVDPVTLASLLVDEGLPADVKFEIAVVACFSAGVEDDSRQTVQSFAQRLAGALAGRKFKCRVYGATGMTFGKGNEVKVATNLEPGPNGELVLDWQTRSRLDDLPNAPFYRRFFRSF